MALRPFLRPELLRRRWDLAAMAGLGAGCSLAAGDLNSWERLLVEAGVVTVLACTHAVRGVAEERPWLPVGPALAVTGIGLLACLLLAGAVAPATLTGPWLAARGVLLAWGLAVAAAGEAAGQRLGPRGAALAVLGAPVAACFLSPIVFSPVFPTGTSLALLVCPVVAAGRALGIEVAIRPPLYDLSVLGVVEFRYPPYPLHPLLALVLAAGFVRRAARRKVLTCAG